MDLHRDRLSVLLLHVKHGSAEAGLRAGKLVDQVKLRSICLRLSFSQRDSSSMQPHLSVSQLGGAEVKVARSLRDTRMLCDL